MHGNLIILWKEAVMSCIEVIYLHCRESRINSTAYNEIPAALRNVQLQQDQARS
jgi:hypothetical protein